MRIELLWFSDCPNHEAADRLLRERMTALGLEAEVHRLQVEDEGRGKEVCFPGSPTIRVDGIDVEPGWTPCSDCTPCCRLYATPNGLRGLPEAAWIDAALHQAAGR